VAIERICNFLAADEIDRKYYSNCDAKVLVIFLTKKKTGGGGGGRQMLTGLTLTTSQEASNPKGVEFSRIESAGGGECVCVYVRE